MIVVIFFEIIAKDTHSQGIKSRANIGIPIADFGLEKLLPILPRRILKEIHVFHHPMPKDCHFFFSCSSSARSCSGTGNPILAAFSRIEMPSFEM